MTVDVEKLLQYTFSPFLHTYTERDVSLYALGVGAPLNPLDASELRFVYELAGDFQALPTFPVLFPSKMLIEVLTGDLPGLQFNPMMLVHGEQYLELRGALPTSGSVRCEAHISGCYDKGSGALLVTDVLCKDEQTQQEVAFLQLSMFIRGVGGFGGERGTGAVIPSIPDRAPDVEMLQETSPNQALIYRLSGDTNPLHADPNMAAVGGFDRPILHGLATMGFSARAVLRHFCQNEAQHFKSIRVRFAKPVFPGESLLTRMWHLPEENAVVFETTVPERDAVVLNNAVVYLK